MNAFAMPLASTRLPNTATDPIVRSGASMGGAMQNAFAASAKPSGAGQAMTNAFAKASMPSAQPSPMASPAQNPFAISQPASPGPLANAFKGFATGLLGVDKINAMDDRYKAQDAEEGKKKLAMLQQFRAMPVEQRMAALPQLSQAIGKEVPPDTMSDQAIDAQVAMMSGQLGIAPATPEYMNLGGGAVGKVANGQFTMAHEAPAEPVKPTIVNNRVIDPNDPRKVLADYSDPAKPADLPEGMWYGPDGKGQPQPIPGYEGMKARIAAAGRAPSSDRGGLTGYQAVQTQMKLDDLDRELTAGDEKARNSLATLDSSIALLDKFTSDTDKFNATYGNMMNPTGKKDDMFNWSIAMDDNRKDGMAMLNQLGGQAFIDSIREMKSAGGAGSLSDAEGTKLAVAATRLMEVNQTDAAAKEAADEFRLRLSTFRNALEKDMAAKRQAEVGRRQQMQAMMGAGGQRAPTAEDASDDDILSALGLK